MVELTIAVAVETRYMKMVDVCTIWAVLRSCATATVEKRARMEMRRAMMGEKERDIVCSLKCCVVCLVCVCVRILMRIRALRCCGADDAL